MKPEKTAPVLAITPNEQIFLPKCYWKIQCKLPPKTKRFCPLVLK